MNLAQFAAYRGEAWATRELRLAAAGQKSDATRTWPGKFAHARKLAGEFGKPRLVQLLAEIIQKQASATWELG
jgi:hypothetical protein